MIRNDKYLFHFTCANEKNKVQMVLWLLGALMVGETDGMKKKANEKAMKVQLVTIVIVT